MNGQSRRLLLALPNYAGALHALMGEAGHLRPQRRLDPSVSKS